MNRNRSALPQTKQQTPKAAKRYGGLLPVLLVALYLLPGTIGHDPWRGDDVRQIDIVASLVASGDWLFPHLAGQPFFDFGPLWYWLGALLARLFESILPFHDAARLATSLFVGLALWGVAQAARKLSGAESQNAAMLLLLGTLGLTIHAHQAHPASALMAVQAISLASFARIAERPVAAALAAALATLAAFLVAGFAGLLLTAPLFVVLALLCPQCRTPRINAALWLALALALALCALWMWWLHAANADLFTLWYEHNLNALLPTADHGGTALKWLALFGWTLWPLWPLALWQLWRSRRNLLLLPALLPVSMLLVALLQALLSTDASIERALPLLPALSVLAASALPRLRRGAANAFDWFAVMCFGVFAILVWLAWSAQTFAWPSGLARSLARLAPRFDLHSSHAVLLLALAIFIAWLIAIRLLPKTPIRAAISWALGMTMLWNLAVTLLQPWFEHDRSYRPMVAALHQKLATLPPANCIASADTTNSHHAALHYFANIVVVDSLQQQRAAQNCTRLFIRHQSHANNTPDARRWRMVWQYRHGGGRHLELFQLYEQL